MYNIIHSKNVLYKHNVLIVKKLGIDGCIKYKAVFCSKIRRKGFEDNRKAVINKDLVETIKKETAESSEKPQSTEKMQESISRARSRIFEYSFCNRWDYFITLTIDPEKYDRYNLPKYIKDLGKWINNYNSYYKSKITYLLVPEQHKDGAWHLHGLISGILPEHLVINEHGYLDFPKYREKFGFISLDPVKSHERISKYITKYIGKDLKERKSGDRLYYCSKGLKRAEKLYEIEDVDDTYLDWDFEHEDGYTKVKTYDSLDFMENVAIFDTQPDPDFEPLPEPPFPIPKKEKAPLNEVKKSFIVPEEYRYLMTKMFDRTITEDELAFLKDLLKRLELNELNR